jgi:CubicO group peptidase (beta-lactamase class C family)
MIMKYLPIALFLFALLQFGASKAQQKADMGDMAKEIDEYVNSAFKLGEFNGAVLVARKGEVILEKGYGWRNFVTRAPNDSNSVSQIGSLTKPFTAMVILKLQEEGKLSVNDRLSKYFPQQKGAGQITLQNLLDHTSGLNNYTDIFGPEDSAIISHPVSQQRVMDIFNKKPPAFKPGTKFEYCNSGYFLLGVIIEKLTGMSYEEAVRKLILSSLHMDHTGFDFINLHSASKATGYLTADADKPEPAVLMDSTVTYSAGAIYSTTGDLYKWATAIGKGEILSKSSWEQAFTPHLEHYGDGWWTDTLFGEKYITHSGGLQGFMSNFMYYPDKDVTIILLNNFGNYGGSLSAINSDLSAIVFNRPYTLWQTHIALKVDNTILQQYVGTYTLDGKVKVFITLKGGQLYAESNSSNGIPKLPIYPKSQNEFFLKDFNAVFAFVRDADGNVSKFISHESGKDIEFKKIK